MSRFLNPFFFAILLVAQIPPKRGVLVHKNSLASYQRCCHSVEPRALRCPWKRIEISLVFVTIMLNVLMYIVSNKLFWNWNGVVRFVSQKVWFDKGFVISNFRDNCLVQIVSLWSWSSNNFYYKWICRQNKKLEIKCIPKWLRRGFFMEKMCRRPCFLWKKMRRRQDLSNKMCRRMEFWPSSHGCSVLLMQ